LRFRGQSQVAWSAAVVRSGSKEHKPKRSVPDMLVHVFFGVNLSAIVVIAICGAIAGLLGVVLRSLALDLGDSAVNWLVAGLMFLAGAGAEGLGFKPRVLFIPFWFVGLVVLVVHSFNEWGWWGLISAGVALLGVLGWLGYRTEKQEWQQAPESLEELKVALLSEDEQVAWDHLKTAFFVPEVFDLDPVMVEHDLQVLALMLEHLGDRLGEPERADIRRLERAMQSVRQGDVEGVKPEVFQAVKSIIECRATGD
jgi:hypothetical protein